MIFDPRAGYGWTALTPSELARTCPFGQQAARRMYVRMVSVVSFGFSNVAVVVWSPPMTNPGPTPSSGGEHHYDYRAILPIIASVLGLLVAILALPNSRLKILLCCTPAVVLGVLFLSSRFRQWKAWSVVGPLVSVGLAIVSGIWFASSISLAKVASSLRSESAPALSSDQVLSFVHPRDGLISRCVHLEGTGALRGYRTWVMFHSVDNNEFYGGPADTDPADPASWSVNFTVGDAKDRQGRFVFYAVGVDAKVAQTLSSIGGPRSFLTTLPPHVEPVATMTVTRNGQDREGCN
jgi:hypothetical protein